MTKQKLKAIKPNRMVKNGRIIVIECDYGSSFKLRQVSFVVIKHPVEYPFLYYTMGFLHQVVLKMYGRHYREKRPF